MAKNPLTKSREMEDGDDLDEGVTTAWDSGVILDRARHFRQELEAPFCRYCGRRHHPASRQP